MPEITNQIPAPEDRLPAVGVPLPAGSTVESPIPSPTMLRMT